MTKFIEQWSPIAPDDLGLKAAYWSGEDADPITYRRLVGWVTVTGRAADAAPNTPFLNKFFPVVINDDWFPQAAWDLPNYGGVVPKDISDGGARDAIRRWRTAGPGDNVQVNVRTVGQA